MQSLNSAKSPVKKRLLASASSEAIKTRHHLDPRAGAVIHLAPAGDDDSLLDTVSTAKWLGVSTQYLELGRHLGYGPKFIRLSARCIRYRKGAVLDWLKTRQHASTSEYSSGGAA
jgi:hypothetical protein